MKLNISSIAVAFITAILYCGNLNAQESGWYTGIAAGISSTSMDASIWDDNSIISSTLETEGFSYHIFGGYQLNSLFSLEASYLKIADTVFEGVSTGVDTIWNSGSVQGTNRIDGLTLQGVIWLPSGINDVQLYIKGGLFFSDALTIYNTTINDIDRFHDDAGTLIGGAGLQTRPWRGWQLRGEIQYAPVPLPDGQNAGVSYVTLGVVHPIK